MFVTMNIAFLLHVFFTDLCFHATNLIHTVAIMAFQLGKSIKIVNLSGN